MTRDTAERFARRLAKRRAARGASGVAYVVWSDEPMDTRGEHYHPCGPDRRAIATLDTQDRRRRLAELGIS